MGEILKGIISLMILFILGMFICQFFFNFNPISYTEDKLTTKIISTNYSCLDIKEKYGKYSYNNVSWKINDICDNECETKFGKDYSLSFWKKNSKCENSEENITCVCRKKT